VDRDRLFLAPLGKPRDYVDRPELSVRDEPECIGPAILNSYADVNRRIFTQQHVLDVAQAQERRPELTPQNRVDDLRRRAKDGRYQDLTRPLHVIQKELDKARFRGQPAGARTVAKIEAIEALLDGVTMQRLAA
jgi:hypothetical protein